MTSEEHFFFLERVLPFLVLAVFVFILIIDDDHTEAASLAQFWRDTCFCYCFLASTSMCPGEGGRGNNTEI